MIAVGDIVLYHFQTYVRRGDSTLEIRTRPAIVTSIGTDTRHLGPANAPVRQILNLHVFFEFSDAQTGDPATSYTTPQARLANERRDVLPAFGDPLNHSWSSKTTSSKRPSWALKDSPFGDPR